MKINRFNNFKLLEYLLLSMPICFGLFYSIGRTYIYSYLDYFGVPNGLFPIPVYDAVLFGFELFCLTCFGLIKFCACLFLFCLVIPTIDIVTNRFEFSILKKISKNTQIISSKTKKLILNLSEDTKSTVYTYYKIACFTLVILFILSAFALAIIMTKDYAKKQAIKDEKKIMLNLKQLDKKLNHISSGLFLFVKKNNNKIIGHLLAENVSLVAILTIQGLIILPVSELYDIQNYKAII